jgi:hypothetical protein
LPSGLLSRARAAAAGVDISVSACTGRAARSVHAENRAVVRIPEPDNAFGTDRDPVHTPGANKCPIRASGILKYPSVLFVPEDRMPPGHA